jgi:predicted cupin superfamily sugar epimerase
MNNKHQSHKKNNKSYNTNIKPSYILSKHVNKMSIYREHAHKIYQILTHTNISNFHAHKIHQIFMHTKYIKFSYAHFNEMMETEVRRRSGYMNAEQIKVYEIKHLKIFS